MPDPVLLIKAMLAAAACAACIVLASRRPWRAPRPALLEAGGALAVGLAFALGATIIGLRLPWPPIPVEDQQRLMLLALPAALVVELLAATGRIPGALVWIARLGVAIALPRILLHSTKYITDLFGADTREWSPASAWLIFAGIGALTTAAQWSLLALERRTGALSQSVGLAIAALASGLTIMLSGYSSAGQLAFPLVGALAGATIAALGAPRGAGSAGAISMGTIVLAALLTIGRFFSDLPTLPALALFAAPHLAWLVEIPAARGWRAWARAVVAGLLVTATVGIVVADAQRKFAAANAWHEQ